MTGASVCIGSRQGSQKGFGRDDAPAERWGHSVVAIEHDLDLIAEADWAIDLGPEGGVRGGAIVAETTSEGLVRCKPSHTGAALRPVLARV